MKYVKGASATPGLNSFLVYHQVLVIVIGTEYSACGLTQKHIRNQDAICLCWERDANPFFAEDAEHDRVGQASLGF